MSRDIVAKSSKTRKIFFLNLKTEQILNNTHVRCLLLKKNKDIFNANIVMNILAYFNPSSL